MPLHFVVPNFDILENFEFELLRCPEAVSVNQFAFERLEKALCHSVIPTITLAQHALYNTFIQRVKESFRDKGNKKKEFLYLFIQDKNKLQELASYYKGGNTELFKALESTYISDLISEVRVRVKKRNVDGNITFKELSEGEQQLLTVLGLLRFTRDEETLILLDEPDTHLNPLWKWEYLDLLKAVVKKDTTTDKEDDTTQVILNTHDPLVIGSMSKNQVRIFRRDTDSGKIFAEQPDVSPKGLGVAGILTSELFGLPTILDKETQGKLNRKRFLQGRIIRKRNDIYYHQPGRKKVYRYWKCPAIHQTSETDEHFSHFSESDRLY